MGNTAEAGSISSTDQVLRAVIECREYAKSATRQSVSELTGLPLTTVDDRIKFLRSIGKIRLAGGRVHGVYEIADDRAEDRAISSTIQSNGRYKLEIGDTVLELSPREARHIGILYAGVTLQFQGL